MGRIFKRPVVLLLGPLPPPVMGPAIATEILLRSSLSRAFEIVHVNTNVHKTIRTLGVLSLSLILRNAKAYVFMLRQILLKRPKIVLIPISQTTTGFLKDSVYILIALLLRLPVLVQLRGGNFLHWFNNAPRSVQKYARTIIRHTRGVIVLGNKLRRQFASFYHDDCIFVVPNGADFDVVPSGKKHNGVVHILYLANLQPSKGIEDLLAALCILKGRAPHHRIRTDVAGSWLDDGTEHRCMTVIRDNQLDIVFHNAVIGKTKWDILLNADIFVFPPREQEGHPWVIIEAMAAGLPIISTDQGAITESVIDGMNGFIVDKQDPAQIAEKIMLLMQDDELRFRMGKESRRLYEENFTEERMVERLSHAFNAVLSGRCAG